MSALSALCRTTKAGHKAMSYAGCISRPALTPRPNWCAVCRGAVLDVAVDLREGSPTFGRHIAVELSDENHCMLFIPRGFAHGFAVLGDSATFQYKCDNYYHPGSEAGINPFDPALAIQWPFDPAYAIVSDKDKKHPMLAQAGKSIFLKTDE